MMFKKLVQDLTEKSLKLEAQTGQKVYPKFLNTKQRNVLDEELHVRQRCEFIPVYIKLIMFGTSEQGS